MHIKFDSCSFHMGATVFLGFHGDVVIDTLMEYTSHSVRVQLRNRFTVRNMKEIHALVQSTE